MKNKKTIIVTIPIIIVISAIIILFCIHLSKVTHKELISIFNIEDDYELLNKIDTLNSENYRYTENKNHSITYIWDNVMIDNYKYDCIQITDDFEIIQMILVELSFYNIKDLDSYIKDFSKEYGDYTHIREDTYEWRKDGKTIEIWIHRMDGNPYKASITIER